MLRDTKIEHKGCCIACILVLFFFSASEAVRCLRCDDAIQPRHCHFLTECDPTEDCYVEQFTTDRGARIYDVGCRARNTCNTPRSFGLGDILKRQVGARGSVTCSQCCQGDLCNANGCGEPGYPASRGPICYNCKQTLDPSRCDVIAVCAADELCSIDERREFGDRFYTTSCKSKHLCSQGSSIVGKRDAEGDLEDGLFRASSGCTGCCNTDFCNLNCFLNGSSANNTGSVGTFRPATTSMMSTFSSSVSISAVGKTQQATSLTVPIPPTTPQTKYSGVIRLVNGNSSNEGRVEVFNNGQWGTVCDDSWSEKDAIVVCRMLGYHNGAMPFTNAHFGPGKEPTWLDDVRCNGTESEIDKCRHNPWGSENCNHNEDAGVHCIDPSEITKVRLVNGKSKNEGRVEVFHNGQWGTVCDDFWVEADANIICKQLGYSSGTPFVSAHFGPGSGSIFLDDVHCTGREFDISQCKHAGWAQGNCGHSEDAGVRCV